MGEPGYKAVLEAFGSRFHGTAVQSEAAEYIFPPVVQCSSLRGSGFDAIAPHVAQSACRAVRTSRSLNGAHVDIFATQLAESLLERGAALAHCLPSRRIRIASTSIRTPTSHRASLPLFGLLEPKAKRKARFHNELWLSTLLHIYMNMKGSAVWRVVFFFP